MTAQPAKTRPGRTASQYRPNVLNVGPALNNAHLTTITCHGGCPSSDLVSTFQSLKETNHLTLVSLGSQRNQKKKQSLSNVGRMSYDYQSLHFDLTNVIWAVGQVNEDQVDRRQDGRTDSSHASLQFERQV